MESGIDKPTYPDFFIVGAAKSGTTSLAHYLAQHPLVFAPEIKEPRFFAKDSILRGSDEDPIKKNVINESVFNDAAYQKLYSNKGEKLTFDASVHYLYHHEEAIPKIKSTIGDAPIIIMLRNPVDRAISNIRYMYEVHFNSVEKEFDKAQEYVDKNWNSFWYYIALGFYAEQVSAYLKNFSKVHIMLFDDLISDTETTYNNTLSFLGLPNISLEDFSKENASEKPNMVYQIAKTSGFTSLIKLVVPEQKLKNLKAKYNDKLTKPHDRVDQELRSNMIHSYMEDISKLESLIGRDLASWKIPKPKI